MLPGLALTVPIAVAASQTTTSRPVTAKARAAANPTAPAPTVTPARSRARPPMRAPGPTWQSGPIDALASTAALESTIAEG